MIVKLKRPTNDAPHMSNCNSLQPKAQKLQTKVFKYSNTIIFAIIIFIIIVNFINTIISKLFEFVCFSL